MQTRKVLREAVEKAKSLRQVVADLSVRATIVRNGAGVRDGGRGFTLTTHVTGSCRCNKGARPSAPV